VVARAGIGLVGSLGRRPRPRSSGTDALRRRSSDQDLDRFAKVDAIKPAYKRDRAVTFASATPTVENLLHGVDRKPIVTAAMRTGTDMLSAGLAGLLQREPVLGRNVRDVDRARLRNVIRIKAAAGIDDRHVGSLAQDLDRA